MTLSNLPQWLFLVGIFHPLLSVVMNPVSFRWQLSNVLSVVGLVSTLVALGFTLALPSTLLLPAVDSGLEGTPPTMLSLFQFNHLTIAMLVLIQVIAFVVLRYAHTNFEHDQDNPRFLLWFKCTVFAVTMTVASNHLVLFWLSWVGISMSLHQLLSFYPDRYRAMLAAHKKFIFARTAEILLAVAFVLLANHHHTFYISEILSAYPLVNVGVDLQVAMVLIAMVALIKCAQLPIHGWLIQVVESPTPVSALLHAGIINLGGFLLLTFAPLLNQSDVARGLILLISGLTTVLAALIMMTRISVKVRLAWSTLAQMGLMLVECALGLYSLAFLHLLAHSFYKANAFLSAGTVVQSYQQERFSPPTLPSNARWLVAAVISGALLLGSMHLLNAMPPISPWLLLACSLTCLLAMNTQHVNPLHVLGGCVFLIASYLVLKTGVAHWLQPTPAPYYWQADAWIALLIVLHFAVYLLMQLHPGKPFTRKLFTWLNAGFYLDEWSTNITLRWWPIALVQSGQHATPVHAAPVKEGK